MSDVQFIFDTDALTRELSDTARKQMPFALSLALNSTTNDMQQAIRNRVQGGNRFVIRTAASRQFLLRQIRRNPGQDFATKRDLVARVRIQNTQSQSPSLLSLLDQGGVRTPRFALSPSITRGSDLPIPVRRSKTATVSRSTFPGKLNLRQQGKALRGDRRTFVVRTKAGDTLLLQRHGKRKVRTLFVLERQANVRAKNFFGPAAESAALTRFDGNLVRGMEQALRTAR
jgi:hypothetical protein